MDAVGQIIKSDLFKYGMLAPLGVAISWYTDPDLDRGRAAQTAVTEEILNIGIASTGIGAVVLAADSGVQIFGEVAEISMKNAGPIYGDGWEEIYYQQSYSLDDNFDRIYLGNIKHDLAHVAVDSYPVAKYFNPATAPKELATTAMEISAGQTTWSQEWNEVSRTFEIINQDLLELQGHVLDLPAGLLDTSVDLGTNAFIKNLAEVDKSISQFPVSNEWKTSIHETSLRVGQKLANLDQTWENDVVALFSP